MGNSNNKDKKINIFTIKIILVIVFVLLLIAGGTYAFWTWTSNVNKNVVFSTANIEDYVVYNEGNSYFIGNFQPTDTFCESTNTTLSFYKKEEATDIKLVASIKMDINSIGDNIFLSNDVYWIVTSGSNEIDCSNGFNSDNVLSYGTFNGIGAGDTINMLDDIEIQLTEQFYTVWIWIDSTGESLSSLSGETIDTNVWTLIEMVEKVDYKEELLNGADPVLDDGMIPITLSSTGVATVADTSSEWYDYETKQWANAVLVSSASRSTYLNNPGTTINDSDILAYYVWIPRYKYQIWTTTKSSKGSEQTIEIVFEGANDPITQGSAVGDYMTHPGFIFGDDTVAGIWVGKFETSGTASAPKIKPNVSSLRSQNVSTQFTTSLKFAGGTLTDGVVSFDGNDTYGLTTKSDSHMMKNSEWGAVAYLSHSQYGINSEIYINNSSGYYTGISGGNVGGSVNTLATQFPDSQTSTSQYNSYGYYTWTGQAIGSDGTIGEITDATLGTKASTTGNITGVYDMSGGAWEYVMGNYAQTTGSSGFSTFPENKYYDLYNITSVSSCTLDSCGGDALFETANWYSDYANFVVSSGPWFVRGGYRSGASVGAFDSSSDSGRADGLYSWRSSLLVAD